MPAARRLNPLTRRYGSGRARPLTGGATAVSEPNADSAISFCLPNSHPLDDRFWIESGKAAQLDER